MLAYPERENAFSYVCIYVNMFYLAISIITGRSIDHHLINEFIIGELISTLQNAYLSS
jgi:hypothetical protein